jgi:hypothetical protein
MRACQTSSQTSGGFEPRAESLASVCGGAGFDHVERALLPACRRDRKNLAGKSARATFTTDFSKAVEMCG